MLHACNNIAVTDLCLIVYTGDDPNQNAKFSHTSNGVDLHSYYPTLPQITPRTSRNEDSNRPPVVTKTSPTPMSSARHQVNQNASQNRHDPNLSNREYSDSQKSDKLNKSYPPQNNARDRHNSNPQNRHSSNPQNSDPYDNHKSQWTDNRQDSVNNTQAKPNNNNASSTQIIKPSRDLRVSHPPSNSDPHTDPSQHHLAGSPRRHPGSGQGESGQEDYLRPLSATPPLVQNEKARSVKPLQHGSSDNQHKHDDANGITGYTPETYRDNEPLDR